MLILIILINLVFNLEVLGENNEFYKQNHYFGSRDKEFLKCSNINNITNNELSIIKWIENNDKNFDNTINYLVNKDLNIINIFNVTSSLFETIAGIPFENGYRDGYLFNSLFNNPEVVLYNRYNKTRNEYFKNNKKISLNNKDLEQCVKDNGFETNINSIIINFPNNNTNFTFDFEYLLVSDSKNNCIRIIIFKYNLIKTIAGQCGRSGFKDGPLGINLLNYPKYLGINDIGNIYIYDSLNNKLRFLEITFNISNNEITFDANLKTFINGNCMNLTTSYLNNYPSSSLYQFDFSFYKYSLCYNKWIENNPSTTNFFDFNNFNDFCTSTYKNCTNKQNNPILQEPNYIN